MSALYQALLAVQKDMPPIPKESVNPFHKSTYASLDTVLHIVRPVLSKHGLVLSQAVTTPDRNEAGAVTAFTIVTTLTHAETAEALSSPVVMPLAKSDPQGAGGAITYGRRYGIQLALGITGEEDDDGNAASRPAKPAPKPRPAEEPARYPQKSAPDTVMPFGKTKGKKLSELSDVELANAKAWMLETDAKKFAALIASIEEMQELNRIAVEDRNT